MAPKKGGLGKGLDLLIPSGIYEEEVTSSSASKKGKSGNEEVKPDLLVKISKVEPNRDQPRRNFAEDALDELADSIRQVGIIQPLIVKKKDDHYEIIAGERRWRAAKMAGLKEVPVIIREYSEQEQMEIALIENIQREDLNPIEEALAYQKLSEMFHVKHEDIAERVGKSRTAVTNSMRLLKLDPKVQEMLSQGLISSGHARALLALENGDQQIETAQKIVDEQWNVRDTEKWIKKLTAPEKVKKTVSKETHNDMKLFYEELSQHLSAKLLTKVNVVQKGTHRGKIEIDYYSLEDLERIQKILEERSGEA